MSGILVSGASGYVGGRLVERARATHEVHALWRTREPPACHKWHRVDLDDAEAASATVATVRPDALIHAAYDPQRGPGPNQAHARTLLAATRAVGARFVFVSTDMVFNGRRGWYSESDAPDATLPYGRWKAELEAEVLAAGGVVARTALVWSLDPRPENVETLILEPLRAGQTPRLFADEWRTPTEVHELADALVQAVAVEGPRILHLCGPERISRLELGRLIVRRLGHDPSLLQPFSRAELAPERPRDISLCATTTRDVIRVTMHGPTEFLSD